MEAIGLQAILDDKNFQAGMQRYTQGLGKMGSLTDRTAALISGSFKMMAAGVAVLGGVGAVIGKVGFDFNAMREQAEVAFSTILGSGVKAKQLLDELQTFAAATPFEFPELVDASKKLLAFGFEAKDIVPIMTRLGDVSAGLNIPVSELADIYGKMRVQGRLFADDLNQLQGRGIPVTQMLAKQFGVAESEIRKMVESGKVGFPEVEKVFKALTDKGGKFAGMMEKQSQTFSGLMSTLKDTLTQAAGALSKPIFDRATKWLKGITDLLSSPRIQSGIKVFADKIEKVLEILEDMAGGKWYAIWELRSLLEKTFGYETTRKIFDVIGAFQLFAQRVRKAFNALRSGWNEARGDFSDLYSVLVDLVGVNAAGFLADLAGGIKKVVDAFNTGGITGALKSIGTQVADYLKTNWPAISAQLATWKDQFWDWLTGKGGALSQVGAKIYEIASSIGSWLQTNWDTTIQPALLSWAGQFWDWITDPSSGVIVTIAANMEQLTKNIRDWATAPDTQKELNKIGEEIARGIINGIGDLFRQDSEGKSLIETLINTLYRAIRNLYESIMELGRGIAVGILNGFMEKINVDQTLQQAVVNTFNAFWNRVITALEDPAGPLMGYIKQMVDWWWGIFSNAINGLMGGLSAQGTASGAAGGVAGPGGLAGPGYANGGWVNRTGMALVHRGEYVIPARTMQTINNSRSIGAVSVTIQGSTGMGKAAIKQAVYEGISEVLSAA